MHFVKQFMQNAEDIVNYVTVCVHWVITRLRVLSMQQTKQGGGKGMSALLDEHWDPEAVAHARAALRGIIEEQSVIWKVECGKKQSPKEAEASAIHGTGIEDSDDDVEVLD